MLLIRMSSLGDIILTTPLLAALRERYPEARIDLVIAKEYASLIPILPGLSEVHVFDRTTGLAGLHALRTSLLANRYDHVLDLHNNLRSRFLRRGLAPNITVVDKRTMKRWMLVKYKYDLLRNEPDVIGRYFETVRKLGITDPCIGPVLTTASQSQQNRVAIAPGARHWNKRWPVEYYVELCRDLLAKGYRIDLHGAAEDRDITEEIMREVANERCTDHAGKLSLEDAARTIARASIAITNDSGLMHMAQAAGVPVISFFGPTVRHFGFAPRGPHAKVLEVEGLYCRPCTAIGLPNCPEKHFRCMREITPSAVSALLPVLTTSQPDTSSAS